MAGTEPRRCKAIANYIAKSDEELSFKEGDVIYVPVRNKDEFWTGVLAGKVESGQGDEAIAMDFQLTYSNRLGWVCNECRLESFRAYWLTIRQWRSRYVSCATGRSCSSLDLTGIDTNGCGSPQEPGKITRVKAIHDYEAKADDELSFPLGATMFVAARLDADWWMGVYNGKNGKIPTSHVQSGENTETLKRRKSSMTPSAGGEGEVGSPCLLPIEAPCLLNRSAWLTLRAT